MPDYINLLRQKQAEKDSALKQQEPGNTDVINTTVQDPLAPVQQPEEVQQEPTPEQQTQELFRQAKHPLIAEEQPIIPDNPYTWTPEYTQRGFIEEIGNSMARGFGKHVIGGTGDIVQLINAVVPGWEIREGNQLSRYLQELGQEYEEEYQVFMPEELKDNKF